jgi:YVTN family beta-propeller protein
MMNVPFLHLAERLAVTHIGCWSLAALMVFGAGGSADGKAKAPGYHVVKKITLGGEGGWDYLTFDPAAHRLYIARSNRVMVVDVDKGKVVGEVPKTPGIHGVALVPKRDRGFTSNGRDSTVTVFDLKNLRAKKQIKVGKRPDAIIYDPASDRVFTCNAGDGTVTAIDATKEKVAGTIKLGGRPEFAVADGKGHVFVNLVDKSEILDLDARKLTVKHRWPLAPGKGPSGLAMDRAHKRLFSTCRNGKMVVLDAASGKVLATPAIGRGTDACAFDPGTGFAFSSNGEGTVTVVREAGKGKFEVVETVKTQRGARTMALDPKTHKLYLVTAKALPGQRWRFQPGSFVVLVVGK